jgi:hypothetical protein
MEVTDEMTEEQCDAKMKDAEEKREVAKMKLETLKTLTAEKREKEIKMRAFLDKLSKVNLETESYLAELAEYENGSLPLAETELSEETAETKLTEETAETELSAKFTKKFTKKFIKKAKKAEAEKQAEEQAEDTVPQPDPITWDDWIAKQPGPIQQLMRYPHKDPSEAGKTLAIQIADLSFNDKLIITGECSKKLNLKIKETRSYDSLDDFYAAFYYEFNAAGMPNEDIHMLVVSEPIALIGTYTVLFTADNMTKIMSIIDEKFDILSIGKYINKDKEDMMRITAIKNEKGFLAELADNVSNVKGKIIDITKDPRSIFHYVNKTGFN